MRSLIQPEYTLLLFLKGGICRETREGFMRVVPNRQGVTLWPIIRQKIQRGSIILHDDARVYRGLHRRDRGPYTHGIVNHSRNFVSPVNRNIYTNSIERRWGLVKGKLRGFLGDQNINMRLGEFLYREHYLKARTDRDKRFRGVHFRRFLQDAVRVYPGYNKQGL